MGKNRLKKPDAKAGGHLRAPDTNSKGSTNHEHPVFCFRYLRNLPICNDTVMVACLKRLGKLASMNWQAIHQAPREGFGYEKIPVAQVSASDLPVMAQGEAFVLSFRLSDTMRMLCLRSDLTLQILHLDEDHTAY